MFALFTKGGIHIKTKKGIYLDLEESEYKVTFKEITFYFSSLLYRNNFGEALTEYLIIVKRTLENRWKINFECELFGAIILYTNIEKRGFLIKYKNKEIKSKDDLCILMNIKA